MRHVVGIAGLIAIGCAPSGGARAVEVELRPDDVRAMAPRFDEGDVVEIAGSPSGAVAVHFTREGAHAVPAEDADADGTPDFIAELARTYDEVLAHYAALGFRAPLSDEGAPEGDGGDARFDVYLVDFAGSSTGAFRRDACEGARCSGHVVQENDFAGYSFASRADAVRILASHELFHAIQSAYDADQPAVLAEGSAVWGTESFAPATDDLERFSRGYLRTSERSLAQAVGGVVDSYAYGAGVFFEFLAERYSPALLRTLLEDTEDGARGVADPVWIEALDAALAREHGSSFEAAWVEHASWNARTGRHADAATSYARGAGLAEIAPVAVTLPHRDDRVRLLRASIRYFALAPEGRGELVVELVAPPDRPRAIDGLWLVGGARDAMVAQRAEEGALIMPATASIVALVRALDHDEDGRVPALCAGSAVEVEECRAAVLAGIVDAAAADAGAALDAGVSRARSSGCDVRGGRGDPSFFGAVLGMALLFGARARAVRECRRRSR